jgi:predicted RNA binding protein YcfA (HicA-like mRNA interferase family)
MPKVYKAVDLYKMLLSFWFQKISQKWSHIKLKNKDLLILILPMHSKDIPYW